MQMRDSPNYDNIFAFFGKNNFVRKFGDVSFTNIISFDEEPIRISLNSTNMVNYRFFKTLT